MTIHAELYVSFPPPDGSKAVLFFFLPRKYARTPSGTLPVSRL